MRISGASRARWKALRRSEGVRLGLLLLGGLFIAASPFVGVLPGPGGIVCFAIGLSLALKNSAWARRRYVAFKRRWPRYGSWTDWGLRRASAKRRHAIAQARAEPPRD